MHIAVKSNEAQKEELLSKKIPSSVKISWCENEWPDADAYFHLSFDETNLLNNIFIKGKIVFANAVITPCNELPENYVRINAWKGFLARDIWELALTDNNKPGASEVLNNLEWKFKLVPDEPGLIAARIISMIINEAYFALGEGGKYKA